MNREEKIAFIRSCNNVYFAYRDLDNCTDSQLDEMIRTIVDSLALSNRPNDLQGTQFYCIYLN